ncbi:MAG: Hsp20/alpha crystallin family protein [Gammaproteobacteria bacterium]|nr:Hsp20/alpha crystallin family protein [Gammaproteobacteria bacterium]
MTTQTSLKKTEHENVVPIRPLTMFEEMERMFEHFMPQNWMHPLKSEHPLFTSNLPQVDVIDQDNSILVRASLPGVKKEDLDVSTTDHSVTIRGSTREEHKEEKGEYYRREIRSGNFLRTVALPASVDEKGIKAKFKDGLLEVTLPKLESEKRHSIKIE